MSIREKGYTVQCCKCLCVIGISSKDFQREEIYCMKHAKEETNKNPKKGWEYKCGHETDGIIILDDNELSMTAYLAWVDFVGMNGTKKMCWDCYSKTTSTAQKNNKKNKQEICDRN